MAEQDNKSVLGDEQTSVEQQSESTSGESIEAADNLEVSGAEEHSPEGPEDELIIQLADDLTIIGISEVYDELAAYLEAEQDLIVDASAVRSVDTAGLQLLLAFSIELDKRDHQLEWRNPSDEFQQMCKLLDLNESLGLKELMA